MKLKKKFEIAWNYPLIQSKFLNKKFVIYIYIIVDVLIINTHFKYNLINKPSDINKKCLFY